VAGHFAGSALADQSTWVHILAALAAGVVGALLAMLAQRVAFALGGFYAGGYLALLAGESLQPGGNLSLWLIVGGVIGAVIATLVMDWAVIVMSSWWVLGPNDGIVSTASLVVGVATAEATRGNVIVAGVAGLVAGAMSMAAGEYVSVSSQLGTASRSTGD
jgi:hypothetical protein